MRIGLDFDNTIISYDEVFQQAAKRMGLIDPDLQGGKKAVRDAIRLRPDGETDWQKLQGFVYGKGISAAKLVHGVDQFLTRCKAEGYPVVIVSHKTEFGHYDSDRVNLRDAALSWMESQGLLSGGFGIEKVYFESTREEKLGRIASLGFTYFVDDLEEVLTDPGFPRSVSGLLYAEGSAVRADAPYMICPSWRHIEEKIFDARS